jgi:hypothetical protein
MPQTTRSGVALHWLKEQLDEFGVARLERWAEWVTCRDQKRLLLAQQHYREERQVRILGDGAQWQVLAFRGADLKGNTDIVVDPGTLVPRSRSAQTQTIFDSIEAGLIDVTRPIDRQKALEQLDLREFETEIGPDRRRAQMENFRMDQGEQVPISPEDNHDVHAMEHLVEMKEPGFVMKTPQVQNAYRQHVIAHHIAKMQQEEVKASAASAPAGEEPALEAPLGSPPPEEGMTPPPAQNGAAPPA